MSSLALLQGPHYSLKTRVLAAAALRCHLYSTDAAGGSTSPQQQQQQQQQEQQQQEHTLERHFTQEEVAAFVRLTGDSNPIHTPAGARVQGLAAPVLPGSLLASLFPALIGSTYPGALYLTQTLRFRRPAEVGEPVAASVAVQRSSGSRVQFSTRIHSVRLRELLVDGEALALIRPTALQKQALGAESSG